MRWRPAARTAAATAIALGAATVAAGRAAPAEMPAPAALPFRVGASVSPATVAIGAPLTLTLRLDVPSSIEQVRPRLTDALGEFEVAAIDGSLPEPHAGGWRQTWRVALRTFEPGERQLPSLPLEYTAAGGRLLSVAIDPAAHVTVVSPSVSPEMPLRGLTRRADVPPPSPWPRILAIGGALSLCLAALAVPLARWWTRARARRQRQAFFAAVERELAALATAPLATAADARERYTRAASLLRRALSRSVPGRLDTLSSADLAERLARAGADRARLAPDLRVSLNAVDAIKFGNTLPAPAQHAATLAAASQVVQALRRLTATDAGTRGRHPGAATS